jgi:hypothetical protein
VVFPQFGAVSLENAGRRLPEQLAATLVSTPDASTIGAAVRALTQLLKPYVAEHDLDQLVRAIRPSLGEGG